MERIEVQVEEHMNFQKSTEKLVMASVYEFQNLPKKLVMSSVYEFQQSTKKVGNGFSIWISKIYQKSW